MSATATDSISARPARAAKTAALAAIQTLFAKEEREDFEERLERFAPIKEAWLAKMQAREARKQAVLEARMAKMLEREARYAAKKAEREAKRAAQPPLSLTRLSRDVAYYMRQLDGEKNCSVVNEELEILINAMHTIRGHMDERHH